MARRGWVVEKGREFRVIVDEVGLDILKAARKIEARASIGRAGRRARRYTKDVGYVFCELKELEIRASKTDIASLAAYGESVKAYLQFWVVPKHRREWSGHFSEYNAGQTTNALHWTRITGQHPQ